MSIRKDSEKAVNTILESEEVLERLSNLVPVGIYLTEVQGKCLYVNGTNLGDVADETKRKIF
jgi:hypothetical protein